MRHRLWWCRRRVLSIASVKHPSNRSPFYWSLSGYGDFHSVSLLNSLGSKQRLGEVELTLVLHLILRLSSRPCIPLVDSSFGSPSSSSLSSSSSSSSPSSCGFSTSFCLFRRMTSMNICTQCPIFWAEASLGQISLSLRRVRIIFYCRAIHICEYVGHYLPKCVVRTHFAPVKNGIRFWIKKKGLSREENLSMGTITQREIVMPAILQ